MNVLSLFDGMSCGQIALNKAGIKYDKYFASEIDKHAIRVTMANFPDTIQLGDVTKLFAKDLPKIDLIIGGSPCQGFSFAGKGLNFDDPRSKLFFEFVRLVKECNPKYFLLENVRMKKEHELVISRYLGVAPVIINSALVSAQNRVRLYWTNINEKEYGLFGDKFSDIPQPKDKGILLKDILESEVDEKYFLSDNLIKMFDLHKKRHDDKKNGLGWKPKTVEEFIKGSSLTTRNGNRPQDNFIIAMRGRGENNEQQLEQNKHGKTNSLTSVQKDNLVIQLNQSKESGGQQTYQQNRVYSIDGISPTLDTRSDQKNILVHNMQPRSGDPTKGGTGHLTGSNGKTYCLDTGNTNAVEMKQRIRRLTPIECERLQTVPDNYTNHVSDSQRYKMLGNGWTIDVIAHILNFINVEKFNLIQNN